MKTRINTLIVLALALTWLSGCGNERQVQALLKHGEEAAQREDHQQALKDYSEAIRLQPKSGLAHFGRGYALAATSRFDEAIEELKEAARLNPEILAPRVYVGNVYMLKEQYDAAITNYEFVLKSEPDNAFALSGRGLAYCQKNLYDQALSDFNAVIDLDPENHGALLGRAKVYAKQGDYLEAIADYEKDIKAMPAAPYAPNMLAWVLATCPDEHIRDGKRALMLAMNICESSHWKVYAYVDTLAAAYAETGDFEKAVKYQKQAASMDGIPDSNRTNVQHRVELYLQHQPYRIKKDNVD